MKEGPSKKRKPDKLLQYTFQNVFSGSFILVFPKSEIKLCEENFRIADLLKFLIL